MSSVAQQTGAPSGGVATANSGALKAQQSDAADLPPGVERLEPRSSVRPRPTLNSYGLTGAIDTPTAGMQPDGQLSATYDTFSGITRGTLSVQILPWAEGAFRYSQLDEFFSDGDDLFDRSFDFKLRLTPETRYWPAVAVGLQDMLGTGIYSGEYVVATKHLHPDVAVSLGLGWGRLGSEGGFENPLRILGDSFKNRNDDSDFGGEVNFGNFFRGENVAPFGSIIWTTPLDGLTLKAEYSSDSYETEVRRGIFRPENQLNFGFEYRPVDAVEIGGYYRYGEEFGLRVSLSGNPLRPPVPQDLEKSPRPIRVRPAGPSTDPEVGPIVTATPVTLTETRPQGSADPVVDPKDKAPQTRAPQTPATVPSATVHRVRRGETLYGLARQYRVSVAALQKTNGITESRSLKAGAALRIPRSTTPQAPDVHVVQRGETVFRISQRYGLTVAALRSLNNIPASNRIEIGQRLRLSADQGPAAQASAPVELKPLPQAGALRALSRIEIDGRWARAGLNPTFVDETAGCPVVTAQEIDAFYGPFGLVTLTLVGRDQPLCSVQLRADGKEIVAQNRRFDPSQAPNVHSTAWHSDPEILAAVTKGVEERLEADGLALEALELAPTRAHLHVKNKTYRAVAQAVGRAARTLANTLPPSVETLEISPVESALPTVTVAISRTDLERLENRPDATRTLWRGATVRDARPAYSALSAGQGKPYPRVSWSIAPDVKLSLFDPDNPARGDLLARADASVEFVPGFSASGSVSKRVIGQLDDISRESDSTLPRVRSDFRLYAREGDPGIDRLTTDVVTKLRDDVSARASAGYLEEFFGGVSGEVLWHPVGQPFAVGAELNYVKQRDFDKLFGFQDYDVLTGHASVYYQLPFYGLEAQVDAGRYLAGDWGATFGLSRRFQSGWEIGGFFTLTDVPFEEFGEGSFDKGITLTIPLDWFAPFPTPQSLNATLRPLTRDGGQRLGVSNRLYPTVRDGSARRIYQHGSEVWQ